MKLSLVLLCGAAFAQQPVPAPLELHSALEDKNFYLLSLLERTPPLFDAITQSRRSALDTAAKTCKVDLPCYAGVFRFSDEQATEVAGALSAAYPNSPALQALVTQLRKSGAYVRHHNLDNPAFLAQAWLDCARGLNHVIDVYALGKPPRYPQIDSITYDPKTPAYPRNIETLVTFLAEDRNSLTHFFSPTLRFALEVLILNHRDEAARHEPLEAAENAPAFERAKSIVWSDYPYSVIVVPGSGNDRPGVRLSPASKLRNEIAAKRFRERKAPFLLVSGGYVHPPQTEYAEAIEMKRDLVARLHIPADAILIDPHARHTTTNMRNAARLLFRYHFPFTRKALVTTDLSQSAAIESPGFEKRCLAELGYLPYKILGRVSPFDLEFLPTLDSLHIDPRDPLDP